jgi:putative membrane protein
MEMMWDWGSGYGWGMMLGGSLMMLLFWGSLALQVVLAVRGFSGSKQLDNASETLRRRPAAGEITPEEYGRTLKALQG